MQLIADAIAATVAARTATLDFTIRRDEPLGRLTASLGSGPADLTRRWVHLRRDDHRDDILDGPTAYAEVLDDDDAPADPPAWRRDGTRDGFATPLWFLDAKTQWLGPAEALGTRRHRDDVVERHRVRALAYEEPPGRIVAAVQRLADTRPAQPREVEVWLDDAGRIRVIGARSEPPALPDVVSDRFRSDIERLSGSPEHPLWRTVELRRFGRAVEPFVPPEDELAPNFEWSDVTDVARLAWERRGELRGARRRVRRYVYGDKTS